MIALITIAFAPIIAALVVERASFYIVGVVWPR